MRLRRWIVGVVASMVLCVVNGTVGESAVRSSAHLKRATKVVKTVSVKRSTRAKRRVARGKRVRRVQGRVVQVQPRKDFEALLLEDAQTGQVLYAQEGDKEWPTASLAKMMVGLLAMEAVERGQLSLYTPTQISYEASHAGGHTINLRTGEIFPFGELVQAMLVSSANDAAIAVAEKLAGSVEDCVLDMNRRARTLGMIQTSFQTPNGMPLRDGTAGDISSASDMALLGRSLIKYAQVLQWTGLEYVPFRDGQMLLPNTNRLVRTFSGVDGLKTGYTNKAHFNLVATAQRGDLRLIAVVLGARSSGVRFRTAAGLLEWGFENFTRLQVLREGQPLDTEVRVEHGTVSTLRPVAASDAVLLVPKKEAADLQVSFSVPPVITAPVLRHQVLGGAVVYNQERILTIIPALSPWEIPQARWLPAWH